MRSHTLFTKKFIINLASRICSCNLWTLAGIPCRHVVSTIQQNREKLEDYVHAYYHRKTYAKIYNHTMNPINGEGRQPKDTTNPILPPIYKVWPGRPKELRRKQPDEETRPTKLRRENTKNKMQEMPSIWTQHSNLQRATYGSW